MKLNTKFLVQMSGMHGDLPAIRVMLKCEGNSTLHREEMFFVRVGWIGLIQNKIQWRALII